ncbi:MAG TPA: acetate/propionate family kinase [Burkholderiales bacterium]|nr:acetate/propionate family kinase [Burkholderiales bacterium]
MSDAILVLNAGSSTIKFALFASGAEPESDAILRGQVENIGTAPALEARHRNGSITAMPAPAGTAGTAPSLAFLLDWLKPSLSGHRLAGAGHRVVHGGENHSMPVRIDGGVIKSLEALIPLARLHEPIEVEAIKALAKLRPGIPQVACFDTAFHHHRPSVDKLFAIPREYTAAGVKRYGFHGLSYEYIAGRLPQLLGERAGARVVVAHLGSGASMCAMREGRSIATTMGFTALDGLMMGTRCGAIDPGVLLYAIQERGMSAHEVSEILYTRSGLLGVSGISNDMRDLLASDHPHAKEAVELFVYRATRELGALAAVLGGLDALVFTGGIGEHAAEVRAMICEKARWLGVELDAAANRRHQTIISAPASVPVVCVVPTDEEIVIARHTRRLLETAASAP